MKPTLKAGLKHRFAWRVPNTHTVPNLFPGVTEFQSMPRVFATPYMIGLMEWTCMQLIEPYLDPGEGSLGVQVNVSHEAATPPGLTVTVEAECTAVEDMLLTFRIKAHDGVDTIGRGTHQRYVVRWDDFKARVSGKAMTAGTRLQ